MTINEDTGEDVVCPICDAAEYWDCGHLVASLDRSFVDCYGGELFDRDYEFTSVIEDAFLPHLLNGSEPSLGNSTLEELWEEAKNNIRPSEEYMDLDEYILQRFLIELLEEAGAYQIPRSLMDPGGPGMTFSMSILFAEKPTEVVEKAVQLISAEFTKDRQEAAPFVDHILLWDRDPIIRTSDGRWFAKAGGGWFQTEIKEITFSMNPGWFHDEKDPEGWKRCLNSERDVAEVERLVAKVDPKW